MRQLADKLDCERVAHDVKDFEPNAIEHSIGCFLALPCKTI